MQDDTVINSTLQPSNKMNPVIIGIIILAVALVGFKFVQAQNQKDTLVETNEVVVESPQATPTTTTPPLAMEAIEESNMEGSQNPAEIEGDVAVISIEGGSFYFKPNEIRVKKGQKVRIEMKSVSMMHDFVIDELNVKMPVTKSGDTGVVEFTADQVGSFEFYCSVGQHRAQGQVGTLIVE